MDAEQVPPATEDDLSDDLLDNAITTQRYTLYGDAEEVGYNFETFKAKKVNATGFVLRTGTVCHAKITPRSGVCLVVLMFVGRRVGSRSYQDVAYEPATARTVVITTASISAVIAELTDDAKRDMLTVRLASCE